MALGKLKANIKWKMLKLQEFGWKMIFEAFTAQQSGITEGDVQTLRWQVFGFFYNLPTRHPPPPSNHLHWHFLPYKRWQKVDIWIPTMNGPCTYPPFLVNVVKEWPSNPKTTDAEECKILGKPIESRLSIDIKMKRYVSRLVDYQIGPIRKTNLFLKYLFIWRNNHIILDSVSSIFEF